MLGILFKIRNLLTKNSLKVMYYSFVYPYLKYGILFWSSCSQGLFKKIFILQKKIIRCIYFKGRFEHTEPLFKDGEILKLNDIKLTEICKFIYQDLNLYNLFELVTHEEIHNYETRNRSNLAPNQVHSRIAEMFFLNKGLQYYNSLDNTIKYSSNVCSFKFKFYKTSKNFQP